MPFRQTHRGQHPEDAKLFSEKWIPILREAVADLSFLLSRDYSEKSALKVVGDRYQLALRQRRAVLGASCSDAALQYRRAHQIDLHRLVGRSIHIDGYNLLITIEGALAGGLLLRGRDGCIRDLASIHGSYRKVEETQPAIQLIGDAVQQLSPDTVTWYFDAPVSNSGRLKTLLAEVAEASGWNWRVELHPNPDKVLAETEKIVVTSDGWILNRAKAWANLAEYLIDTLGSDLRVIDLGQGRDSSEAP